MSLDKRAFIEFALAQGVLTFGEFTLKSGRQSPYFFNAGLFNSGESLHKLGQFYANTILQAGLEFDLLFGPAYKGIPLVNSTAIALAADHQINKPYAFNRKEAKDHGEKGVIVGHPIQGNVLLIDDVMTAGTAVKESLPLINATGGQLAGIVLALDRQEKGQDARSAVQAIHETYQIPVITIITLQDLLQYLESEQQFQQHVPSMQTYWETYGVNP